VDDEAGEFTSTDATCRSERGQQVSGHGPLFDERECSGRKHDSLYSGVVLRTEHVTHSLAAAPLVG
jgi:hypothetical protein